MWDSINFPFLIFNVATVEVWKWISNFIPHIIEYVVTYSCWDSSQNISVKWAPVNAAEHLRWWVNISSCIMFWCHHALNHYLGHSELRLWKSKSVSNNWSSVIQWNLSVTTTSLIKTITCDLFSNVFWWRLKIPIYSWAHLVGPWPPRWAPAGRKVSH